MAEKQNVDKPTMTEHDKTLKRLAKLDKYNKMSKRPKKDNDSDSDSDSEEEDGPLVVPTQFTLSEVHHIGTRGKFSHVL